MPQPGARELHGIELRLDEVLARRGMTLTELSQRVGLSIVNLSILKNGHAKAIRFSTLTRLCEVLDCQPGDLLKPEPDAVAARKPASAITVEAAEASRVAPRRGRNRTLPPA